MFIFKTHNCIIFLDVDIPLTISNEFCKPIEVMVQVPQPKKRRALIFPVYVKLFRCRGGCKIEPRLSQCIALSKERYLVTIKIIIKNILRKITVLTDSHKKPIYKT